jgi:hypothetical protein
LIDDQLNRSGLVDDQLIIAHISERDADYHLFFHCEGRDFNCHPWSTRSFQLDNLCMLSLFPSLLGKAGMGVVTKSCGEGFLLVKFGKKIKKDPACKVK